MESIVLLKNKQEKNMKEKYISFFEYLSILEYFIEWSCCFVAPSTLLIIIGHILSANQSVTLGNSKLWPLDMYNGLSQVYCIQPN